MTFHGSRLNEPYTTLASDGNAVMRHQIESVSRALSDTGIRWCMLRGELGNAVFEGDIDLLVHDNDLRSAEQILSKSGFLPFPDWDVPSHRHFKKYVGECDRWLTLDIVTELSYGPDFAIRTDAAAGVLERCCWQQGIFRPAPDDEFWTLLWHCMLDKGTFKSAHATRLRELTQDAHQTSRLSQLFARLLFRSWTVHHVISAIEQGQFDRLEALSRSLQEHPHRPGLARGAVRKVGRFIRQVSFRATRPGIVVAFLAPDGAGKSTLSEGIEREFCFPVHVAWLGLGANPEKPVSIFGVTIPGTVLLRQLKKVWNAYLRGTYHRALGRLIIFDRYTYDQMFVLKRKISKKERIFFELLTRSLPAPDRVFVLDLPGQIMFDRKGEWSPEYLEVQRHRFLAIADELPNTVVIDARHDADTVRRTVTEEIWNAYVSRWTRRAKVGIPTTARTRT